MNEDTLFSKLKLDDKEAFTALFERYYEDLVLLAGNLLGEMRPCEDIVQSIFLKLWENRKTTTISVPLRTYLVQSVKNACIDEFRHRQVVGEHLFYIAKTLQASDLSLDVESYMLYTELQSHLEIALSKLPPSYREAFEMNRFQNMKYHQIACELSVSERTVEVRIGKAIALLRHYLREFLISLIFYL